MTEPKHESETQISQNITFESFQESIKGIDNLRDLRAFKKDFYNRDTKILKNGNKPIFEDFTDKKKGDISRPIDRDFSKYVASEEFLDPDGSIIKKFFDDREAELIAIEDLENEERLKEQKRLKEEQSNKSKDKIALEKNINEALDDTIYPGVAELVQDAIDKKDTPEEETISTGSSSEPVIKLEAQEVEKELDAQEELVSTTPESEPVPELEPKIEPEKPIIKEISEENIHNAKNLKELSLILVNSDGIESASQGHFSGADLAFLIERVAKGEAYIEEITRENGLRETVWNLIKNEKGSDPKSLEHEEEQAVREKLEAATAAHETKVEPEIPATALPSHPPAPKDTQKHIIPLTPQTPQKSTWIKRLFGFGGKK